MKFGLVRLVLALSLLSILAACSSFDNMSGRTVGDGEHSLVVTNGTGTRVCWLFILEEGDTSLDQEDDRLGESGVLESNGSITVKLDAGTYYGVAVTQDENESCDNAEGTQIENYPITIEGDVNWRLELP